MAEETHQKMSEDNSTKLRIIVSALTLIYVLTFVGGFLQDTRYNFFNYIFRSGSGNLNRGISGIAA